MTTPNTIVDTMNKAHSHGADAEKAHPSRADRPTSFNLDDIAVPHGREEDWRFTPMRRIERLFEPISAWAPSLLPVTVPQSSPGTASSRRLSSRSLPRPSSTHPCA